MGSCGLDWNSYAGHLYSSKVPYHWPGIILAYDLIQLPPSLTKKKPPNPTHVSHDDKKKKHARKTLESKTAACYAYNFPPPSHNGETVIVTSEY